MVKITDGNKTISVTRGAYDGIFKRQGFKLVKEDVDDDKLLIPVQPAVEDDGGEDGDDATFITDVLEKPVSQWSKKEIKRFAAIREIDLSGTSNASEAKELIKAFLAQSGVE